MSCQIREQRHPDIGGGGARGGHRRRILLVVVRRQPVVLRADEIGEEPPGAAGQGAQEGLLLKAQLRRGRLGRPADPPGGDGGDSQSTSSGMTNGHPVNRVPGTHDKHHCEDHGQSRGDPHLPEELVQAAPSVPPAIRGEIPHQQPPPGEQQADGGAHDGVEVDHRIVWQQHQPEQRP